MSERYDALISYTRFDDENDGAFLTAFRERLSREVQAHRGEPFPIFQDTEDIKLGQPFAERIKDALATITFFIPILTPSFFKSEWCRYELEQFLQREASMGRNDLVLPVYYIRVPGLERAAARANDPLLQTLAERQYIDWRKLRRRSFDLPEVNDTLVEMAEYIADALDAPPPEPPAPTPAPAPAPVPTPAPSSSPPRVTAPSPEPPAPPRVTRPDPIVKLPGGVTLELIEIPEGAFLMGSSDDPDADPDEKPQHRLHLPTYWIGKTPVTNAQFRPFVEGDGYTNRAYWSDDGWQWRTSNWQWRTSNKRTQPLYWNDKQWNGDAQPVVGMTWYEALAYCRWLSVQTGDNYCLPSEAEWEKAARGTDGRIYPWGNQAPDETRANFEGAVRRTTPVGSYPAGASPYGVLDMAGNVWEWTRSEFQKYPYDPDDGREEGSDPAGKQFTLRGGSWNNYRTLVRCAARNGVSPGSGGINNDIDGCRVLLSHTH
jgi:formylglycine-generating enzyme required for sulfatase activity